MQQAADARTEAQRLRDQALVINDSMADEMEVYKVKVKAGDDFMVEADRLDAEADEIYREHRDDGFWWRVYWRRIYLNKRRQADRMRDRAYAAYAEAEQYYDAHLRAPMDQMRAKQEQADALMGQADTLEQQAREACP